MMGGFCVRFCFAVRGWACCDGEWVRIWEVGWVGARKREEESEFFSYGRGRWFERSLLLELDIGYLVVMLSFGLLVGSEPA